MGHSPLDPAFQKRRPWNQGRLLGAKRALKQQQVWAIRFCLDQHRRLRDRALFDFAIDSKLAAATWSRFGSAMSCQAGARATELSSCSRRPNTRCSSS
jgi:hypothetical protein